MDTDRQGVGWEDMTMDQSHIVKLVKAIISISPLTQYPPLLGVIEKGSLEGVSDMRGY